MSAAGLGRAGELLAGAKKDLSDAVVLASSIKQDVDAQLEKVDYQLKRITDVAAFCEGPM